MLRTILLLAAIAASAAVYLEKRSERSARSEDEASPSRSTASLAPSPSSSGAPSNSAGAPSRETSFDRDPTPHFLEEKESGEPLSALDRESLRDALADWAPIPRYLLSEKHDREGMREVAFAAFRSPLLKSSRVRFGPTPTTLTASTLELEDRTTVVMFDPRRSPSGYVGRSPGGVTLRVPTSSIARIDPFSPTEARDAWRTTTGRRVDQLLEAEDLGERRRAIELLLWLGDLERADTVYSTWIRAGGASALLSEGAFADAEDAARDLAHALETTVSPVSEQRPTRPVSEGTTVRTEEGLRKFLESREGLRLLSNPDRLARANECAEWSEWLERRGPQLTLSREEREGLAEELRLFRYDLLKSSGF